MPRLSHEHPASVPVPIPDRIAQMIGTAIPHEVLQAEFDAVAEVREILRLRPLGSDEDRADREAALGRLAGFNKTLAKHHPRMLIRPSEVAA